MTPEAIAALTGGPSGPVAPRYSGGYRVFDYASDPSTIRYRQFADEAKRLGITDPNQIHKYAQDKNIDWGGQHGIKNTDIKRGKIGLGAIMLGGASAFGAGAAGAGSAAAGAGEGAAAAGAGSAAGATALDAELGAAMGWAPASVAGETGVAAGAAGLDEAAMTQAARDQALQGLSSQGITSGASAGAAPGSALSRIFDGSAGTPDWLNVGGNLLSTGLGIYGSRRAADAYGDLNRQYMEMGAPSRARYEASMAPGFDPTTIPGYSGALDTASRGLLARLSATGGNPYGNPGGLLEANRQLVSGTALPAIDAYQRLNAGTGGYAGFNAAAPGMATNQIGAQGGLYNAIGSGVAGLFNPQPSLADTLRGLNIGGLS